MCRLLIVLCDWKRVQTYDLVVPGWGQRFEETVFCCFVLNCFLLLVPSHVQLFCVQAAFHSLEDTPLVCLT